MASIGRTKLTIRVPQLTATGDERDEREQQWDDGATVSAWMKQRQGGRKPTVAGILRAHVYTVRFTARGGVELPQEDWRLRDEDGTEYVVRDAVWTGRTGKLTVERV